jgi:hypothetical protein
MHAPAPPAVHAAAPAHIAAPPMRVAAPPHMGAAVYHVVPGAGRTPVRVLYGSDGVTNVESPVHVTYGISAADRTGYAPVTHLPYHSVPSHVWHNGWIANPYRWPRWGWHYGVPWRPTPCYWGSGFWGPWASSRPPVGSCYWNGSYWGPWGLSATAPVSYGSVLAYNGASAYYPGSYASYGVAPSSPGAELLYDYGLQQTDCNAPNLVVIWGPDDSVICAFPNDLVAPGTYVLDPDTLTLQSQ